MSSVASRTLKYGHVSNVKFKNWVRLIPVKNVSLCAHKRFPFWHWQLTSGGTTRIEKLKSFSESIGINHLPYTNQRPPTSCLKCTDNLSEFISWNQKSSNTKKKYHENRSSFYRITTSSSFIPCLNIRRTLYRYVQQWPMFWGRELCCWYLMVKYVFAQYNTLHLYK